MARHPGCPRTNGPAPVLEISDRLSAETLHWLLQIHHANMRLLIRAALAGPTERGSLILEGAALRPEHCADWPIRGCFAACLTAGDDILRARIHRSSGYPSRPPDIQRAIDAFVERSLREDTALTASAREAGLPRIDVSTQPPDAVRDRLLGLLPPGADPG